MISVLQLQSHRLKAWWLSQLVLVCPSLTRQPVRLQDRKPGGPSRGAELPADLDRHGWEGTRCEESQCST